MSKIGKKKIKIPSNIKIIIKNNNIITKGALGELSIKIDQNIKISLHKDYINTEMIKKSRKYKMIWGLSRSLINNLIIGISKGFKKKLIIIGIGYKIKTYKNYIILSLGFSHDIVYALPKEININIYKNNIISLESYDKYILGRVISDIKNIRKIDPYKGKGIKLLGEKSIKKIGKKK